MRTRIFVALAPPSFQLELGKLDVPFIRLLIA
jgi:hypothetical protein